METVGIRELKNRLSAYVQLTKAVGTSLLLPKEGNRSHYLSH